MKRLSLAVLTLMTPVLMARAQETLYVSMQTAPLRANPAPFAQIIGTMSNGQAVTVLSRQAAWVQVRTQTGTEGWAPQSVFRREKPRLGVGATEARTGTTGREVAAAAKGFSAEVESQYKAQNADLSKFYVIVDRMERERLSEREVQEFLKEGGLL